MFATAIPVLSGTARDALAQPYARFAVPDSARASTLVAGRADFENVWNALLVAELRATLTHADSAKRLVQLERELSQAEPAALGSHIGRDALALRARWKKPQFRSRIDAAVAESLAAVARTARAYSRADSLLLAALDAYRALKERRREAWVLGSLGANALVAGRNADAAAYYSTALGARRALGDSLLVGNTLNDLGQTYVQLSRYDEAYAALAEAAAIREAQGQMGLLGRTLNFLGLALGALGRPDSAMTCYRRAVELTSAQGDRARTLTTLSNFALFLTDNGQTDEAIRVNERALALADSLGNAGQAARIEGNLGHLQRMTGLYTEALAHTQRAIEGFAAAGDASSLALNLIRKGGILIGTGEARAARDVLTRARALADSLGDPVLQSKALSTLALSASELGDIAGAQRLGESGFEAALAAGDSAQVHDAAALLGQLAAVRKEPAQVEHWLVRAIAAGAGMRAETRANDLTALATARQLAGRYDEAERGHREALAIATTHGLPNQMLWTLVSLGDVEERRGRYPAALDYYARAISIADTLRVLQRVERKSISLFANRLFMFEAMIHLLGKLDRIHPDSGYAERAFTWAERSRARAFLDLVAASAGAGTGAGPGLLTLRDAQALLPSDRDALLEYSVGDSSTSLWVIRKSGWKHFVLPARGVLQGRAQALRRGLADPAATANAATSRLQSALYAQLVAPAESVLAGVDRLIVAPDGVLCLIPFEALLSRPVTAGGTPARGSHLGERFAISYTPSASVFATRAARTRGSAVVAIGNPDFGAASAAGGSPNGVHLEALPNTAVEIAMLRGTVGKRAITTLTGSDASRERVMALDGLTQADIIHIATHGDVNELEPEHSGLWFAPDSGTVAPSRVEVADIIGMKLAAELVTLSACETGLGRLESGEGVIGLSRAFMAAGAQNVIVSLWPVNDRSTAQLMSAFYRRALDGTTTPAAALAAAKRDLLADPETRAPFYWAPFILVGRSGR